jgi:hypothetical protein
MQGEEDAESGAYLDQPFSVRFRVDGGVLILKDIKFAGLDLEDKKAQDELLLIQGRYRKKASSRDAEGGW